MTTILPKILAWLHITKIKSLDCMLFIYYYSNRIIYTIRSINLFFMRTFRLQKLKI